MTYTEKRPLRKRKIQGAATCTCSCMTHPYTTIDGGRNTIPKKVDSSRIYSVDRIAVSDGL